MSAFCCGPPQLPAQPAHRDRRTADRMLPARTRQALCRHSAAAEKINAFVLVGNDDTVTLYIHKAEMGQGTVTSLSMLLAEELECDWSKIRTEFPGVDRAYGGFQGVVGSQSIRTLDVAAAGRRAGARNADRRRCAEVGRRLVGIAR